MASVRVCFMCKSEGKQCSNCLHDAEMREDDDSPCGGSANARSKSPLVNSAERIKKFQKVETFSLTPLGALPPFPYPSEGHGTSGSQGNVGPIATVVPSTGGISTGITPATPKFTTDDIMEKLTNIMGQMSTKQDLTNAVGPLTK